MLCCVVWAEEIVDGAEDVVEDDVPFVRPTGNQHSSLRLDEVQHALQGAAAIGQTNHSQTSAMWTAHEQHTIYSLSSLTFISCPLCPSADVSSADFLSKLQAEPELLRGLADPRSVHSTHCNPYRSAGRPYRTQPLHLLWLC